MTTRSTITLGLLILLGFAVVVAFRFADTGEQASASMVLPTARPAEAPVSRESPCDCYPGSCEAQRRASASDDDGIESRWPSDRRHSFSEAGAGKRRQECPHRFRRALRSRRVAAGENLMRIVLLETAPKGDDVARMLDAIQSGGMAGLARRMAVIELRFIPTAQAFDPRRARQRAPHRERRAPQQLRRRAEQPHVGGKPALTPARVASRK